jgi:ABC-type sugar transport system permease subunit
MASAAKARAYTRDGKYIRFAFPALLVIGAVIVFPWLFTIFMSVHDWKVGQESAFVGLDNYVHLAGEERFYEAMGRTLLYTALATFLPVLLGVDRAAKVACIAMAAPQVVVIGLLWAWGSPIYALAITGALAAQVLLMRRLLRDPKGQAPWYNGTGTTLYVAGMLVAAFALRP